MKLQLFVDLDGVFVDMPRQSRELFGFDPKGHLATRDKKAEQVFWKHVEDLYAAGGEFWRSMHPMADYMVLWDYVKKHNPTVLSSRGRIAQAKEEKEDWVSRYLIPNPPVLVTASGRHKALHATPTRVLVDDTVHVIEGWEQAGGIGVLHRNADDTIARLKELFEEEV